MQQRLFLNGEDPARDLLENNRHWAKQMLVSDPEFFARLEHQQKPRYLWFGCSDSRVPANQITGLPPGQVFVHRNIANQVVQTDMNALSVLQYAVDVLGIDQIIVCGHYGCSGIQAALQDTRLGLVDVWLSYIRDIHRLHHSELEALPSLEDRNNRLAELNVMHQVLHIGQTSTMENAWKAGRNIAIHAWIYSLHNGFIRELGVRLISQKDSEDLGRTLHSISCQNSQGHAMRELSR